MRPKPSPEGELGGPVRVEFKVQFNRGPRSRGRAPEAEPARLATTGPPLPAGNLPPGPMPTPAAAIPKVTRMLVLGYWFEWLVRDGKVKNYAEIARLTGLTRARVTQLLNLTLLSPRLQEELLIADRPHKRNSRKGLQMPSCNSPWITTKMSDSSQHAVDYY